MITIHRDICNYCGACVSVCPKSALELIDTYLSVNTDLCKETCLFCAKICPLGAISDEK